MTLAALGCGIVAGWVLWLGAREMLAAPVFERVNRAGRRVSTASGVVVVLGGIGGLVLAIVLDALGADVTGGAPGWWDVRELVVSGSSVVRTWEAVLVAVLGFGFVGLIDDLAGGRSGGGFAGHLSDLARGRVTTGSVKMFGGLLIAFIAAAMVAAGDGADLIASTLLIAATANLANLFDLAPGRTMKAATLGWIALVAAGGIGAELAATSWVVGLGLGLLPSEMAQKHMLGDTGANAIGAAVGLGIAVTVDGTARWVVLAVVVALNLSSEVVSFSRVVDGVAPLRWLDALGTPASIRGSEEGSR
jgi:hypothetical protein